MRSLLRKAKPQSFIRYYFSNQDLPPRQTMQYDVLIVGGGVAGLSAAIRLKQKQAELGKPISVCLIEKGTEIGDHILSGNVFQPRGLDQLYPNWRNMKQNRPPIDTQVNEDAFYFLLGEKNSLRVPNYLFPKTIDNHGNYIISLGNLCRWLNEQATQMGVDVFPGTPGSEVLYTDQNVVRGVATGDFGISKKKEIKQNFQRGIEILAKQTIFAQGCRGSLSEKVIAKYNLRKDSDPQTYGIGLKQVWEVDNRHFRPGYVQHSVGWPLTSDVYGGSFLYHMKPNLVLLGLVVGLSYKNPYLNPYQQFQRMKLHPQIKKYLENGQCISYGARALNQGGYFAIPKLTFPGGVLAGCSAGFLNVLKIKGTHTAIKSGIEAANAIYDKINGVNQEFTDPNIADRYETNMKTSWAWQQLYQSRNFKKSFYNLYTGLAYGGIFKFLKGKQPLDLRITTKDSEKTQPAIKHKPIEYPKHDRKLTFDLLDNLSRSGTNHDHDQPSHLVVKENKQKIPNQSWKQYKAPQQRFCPAKVYQFIDDGKGGKTLQINAQNCLHCKTCSIKMVEQYIQWKTPEGNGGPKYTFM